MVNSAEHDRIVKLLQCINAYLHSDIYSDATASSQIDDLHHALNSARISGTISRDVSREFSTYAETLSHYINSGMRDGPALLPREYFVPTADGSLGRYRMRRAPPYDD